MAEQKKDTPDVVTYVIPKIEVYQITDDELARIEEGSNHINQDLTFMVASFSLCFASIIALLTGSFDASIESTFRAATGVFGLSTVYTGWRWYAHRKNVTKVISNIRSRKEDPEG